MAGKTANEVEEREQWDRVWSSQRHCCINTPLKIDVANAFSFESLPFGKVISATISEDPSAFSDQVLRYFDNCPICGQTTIGMERIAASLHPEFENGVRNISFGVWAHQKCLESCAVIDGPAPIPW